MQHRAASRAQAERSLFICLVYMEQEDSEEKSEKAVTPPAKKGFLKVRAVASIVHLYVLKHLHAA
jgi:hypothetical protein